jgi:DNA-binding beta-propeller fold protein YncE
MTLASVLFLCALLAPAEIFALSAEVVGTVSNPGLKMDGVAWDGESVWVVTYRSSPVEWRIAKLDDSGSVISSFVVPVSSLDDIHNLGMTNITSDGETIWANHWNEGFVYNFDKEGNVLTKFGVPSVNQLIPVGIAWDGEFLYVLHWSDKNLYKLSTSGEELGKVSLRGLAPPPDMGLAWDGEYFWVASKGANRIHRITPDGKLTGTIVGPKKGGGIRDLAWDGEHLLLVYQQDKTIYKLKILE